MPLLSRIAGGMENPHLQCQSCCQSCAGKETGCRALSCSVWPMGLFHRSQCHYRSVWVGTESKPGPSGVCFSRASLSRAVSFVFTFGSSVCGSPEAWDQPRPIWDAKFLSAWSLPQEADLSSESSVPRTRWLLAFGQKWLKSATWGFSGQKCPEAHGGWKLCHQALGPCESLLSQGQGSF